MPATGMVFTSTIQAGLKATLDGVITDDNDVREELDYQKWCEEENQPDQWVDEQEYGGLGLAVERNEGGETAVASIAEGFSKRYIARSFGLRMIISEEAIDDNKYPKIIDAAGRLKRAIWMTVQYDATFMLSRAQNTAYVGGDGQPLWSASHTLPGGGTWSNIVATPIAPSVSAVTAARTQVSHYPSQDGLLANAMIKKVVFPSDQWEVWMGVLGSTNNPIAGNYSEINVVRKMSIEPVEARFWTSTTTQYMFVTNIPNGLKVKWRKRPTQRNWMENGNLSMHHQVNARWGTGWTEARAVLGVPA